MRLSTTYPRKYEAGPNMYSINIVCSSFSDVVSVTKSVLASNEVISE